MQYLLGKNCIDVIARDFNYNFSKVVQNKFLDIFTDHTQILNKSTHIYGSLIDHVHIKRAFMENLRSISDHDDVRIVIEKNSVGFLINP